MDYKKQIDALQRYVSQLQQAGKVIRDTEEKILSIEREVSDLDRELPDADRLYGSEREQVLQLYDLVNTVFQLVDETIGPPRDEVTGADSGTAYMPEARGTCSDFSLDEILSSIKMTGGRHVS